jgi:hypothetical protein
VSDILKRQQVPVKEFIEIVKKKINHGEFIIEDYNVFEICDPIDFAFKGLNLLDIFQQPNTNEHIDASNKKRGKINQPIVFKNIKFNMTEVSLEDQSDDRDFSAFLKFQNCDFGQIIFKAINSKVKFDFSENTLLDEVHIKTHLSETVQFNDVRIEHLDVSEGTNLNDKLNFNGTKFGVKIDKETLGVPKGKPKLGEAPIPAYLHFKSIHFSKMEFFNCTFYIAPDFSGSELTHQTVFSQCHFYDNRRESIAKYRFLRSQMQRLGNERETVMFSSLELETSHLAEFQGRHISRSDKVEKQLSILYSRFSDYGRDILKPLTWILSTFLLFTFLYSFGGLLEVNIESIKKAPNWIQESLLSDNEYRTSLYSSLSESAINSLGPIGYFVEENHIQSHNLIGEITILLQRVFSSLMWFLWILQIRRRFKLS